MRCCRCNQSADADDHAEAWMIFNYDESHIDIFAMPDGCDGYGGYAMCTNHANRLRPPRGWTLTDSREIALTLFPLTSVPPSAEDAADRSSDVA